MKSPVVKRSIVIAGHKTSVSLEDAFWRGLKEIAAARSMTLSDLVASIDTGRDLGNLSSAIRLFVLDHYRSLAAGHAMDDGARTGNDGGDEGGVQHPGDCELACGDALFLGVGLDLHPPPSPGYYRQNRAPGGHNPHGVLKLRRVFCDRGLF